MSSTDCLQPPLRYSVGVPLDWDSRRLKFAVTLRNEKVDSECIDAAYIGLENIESWTGRLIEAEVASGEGVATKFNKGDVLFGKLRPYLAKVYLASESGISSTEALVLTAENMLIPGFLKFVLLSSKFIGSVSGSAYGAKMPRANWDFIGGYSVLVPPLKQQQKIADFLDVKAEKIDALIAKKRVLIERLKEKRLAVIAQAVTKGLDARAPLIDSGILWLGCIPKNWRTPALKMRYAVELGKMLDEKRISGDFLLPYLRNVDVQWGKVNFEDLPEMDIQRSEYARYTIRANDVLVCEGGEVGRSAVIEAGHDVVGYQKALHRLRAEKDGECPKFIFYTMLWAASTGVFAVEESSTIAHLTADQLRRYKFPQPPLEEQKEIADFLDLQYEGMSKLIESTLLAISRLAEYRSALIDSAITGKRDVVDLCGSV